jgi:hypothetical protein
MRKLMLAAVFVFSACDRAATAKERVSATMRDPSSTQFRNVVIGPTGAVCGEVNAKNGYGAYAGFTAFIYSDSLGVQVESDEHPLGAVAQLTLCPRPKGMSQAEYDTTLALSRKLDSLRLVLEQQQKSLDYINGRR